MAKNYKHIIIGAGIAGLSYAYKLKQEAKEFLLIEKSSEVGGNWKSFPYKGSIYEFGPNSFMNRCAELEEMIDSIGFRDQVISHSFKDSRRYLYSKNKLKPVGPQELIFSDLLSLSAKFSILREPFNRKQSQSSDESIYDFMVRRFSPEIADLVSYALQGIWAGDARHLSAKSALTKLYEAQQQHGSIIGGLFQSKKPKKSNKPLATCSFKNGMQSFCNAIADYIHRDNILFNADNIRITILSPNSYTLEINGETFHTPNLVIGTKAFEAAELLEPSSNKLAHALASIFYAPIALHAYTLPRSLFTEPGQQMLSAFGYINGTPNKSTLGTIFSSQLFPERNLPDEYLFLSFTLINSPWELVCGELMEVFQPYIHKALTLDDFNLVDHKSIQCAIPQYQIGYNNIIEDIDTELAKLPGLTLIGNYRGGVSLADTIRSSLRGGRSPTWQSTPTKE